MRLDRYKVKLRMAMAGIENQRELADKVGVTPQTISNWLNGEMPTLDNVGALCRVLNCTPNDILTDPNAISLKPANVLVPA